MTRPEHYRDGSNVHETIFATASGRAKLVEAINSGSAGRLPWCELARRIEGLDGTVRFKIEIRIGTRAGTCSPYLVTNPNGTIFHVGSVLGLIRYSEAVQVEQDDDLIFRAALAIVPGQRALIAIIAGDDEPLVVPTIDEIDRRIDVSDKEWREWSERIGYDGPYRPLVLRSALGLKLLLYSPSGAIAAAATTSLPERIGGPKNFDYRYAWVRDAGYTIKAVLLIGADAEAKAAFTWLIKRLDQHGAKVGEAPLFKHDHETGTRRSYDFGPGRIVGEFTFVPRGPDTAEDDGWLMGLVIEAGGTSKVLEFIDARAIERSPVATIRLPHRMPPGIHGAWLPVRSAGALPR